MRFQIGSLDITIGKKAAVPVTSWPSTAWPYVRESSAGAWQRGVVVPVQDALQNPTFFACVTLIASDLSKCGFELVKEDSDGIYADASSSAFSPVLEQPNHYQNQQQFIEQWALSKLCHGNTLAIKGRDDRQVVDALYILDWTRCKVYLSPRGQVYYALSTDQLAYDALEPFRGGPGDKGDASVVVPAREVIHDRWNCLYHPLIGLGPVYASGMLALQGLTLATNSSKLASQGFRPGGVITSAEPISQENADKFERYWQDNYAGSDNAGKVIVLGGGLKYEKPPAMTAVESEVIKQFGYSDERICATLHVPGFKVGVGPTPSYADTVAFTLDYYSQCLQVLATAIETCIGDGIGATSAGYEISFDEDELMRMDPVTRMKVATDGVKGGIFSPNRGRAMFNEKPLAGGNTIFLQEQDHSLEWIVKRDAQGPPPPKPATPQAPPVAAPAAAKEQVEILHEIRDSFAELAKQCRQQDDLDDADTLTGAALRCLETICET